MSTHETKRLAWAWIAANCRTYPFQANLHGVAGEMVAIQIELTLRQLEAAGAVVDGPGVAAHIATVPPPVPCPDPTCVEHAKPRETFREATIKGLEEYDFDVIADAVAMGAAPPESPEAGAFRRRMDTTPDCPRNSDGICRPWHDDGPTTHCRCGKEL